MSIGTLGAIVATYISSAKSKMLAVTNYLLSDGPMLRKISPGIKWDILSTLGHRPF